MAENLPIDIHSSKLLDWLVSRRHCNKDWQKNVLLIREKIKHAMQDMPEHEEILKLLQGSYINYFHCVRIIDILKETEKDSKNFFGSYSSQRMKDWQEIQNLYKKDNVYLAESAQILQRLVQYDIPGLKRQIAKSDQAVTDSSQKEKDYHRQADEGRRNYEQELKKIGLAGKSLRAEFLALAADLPTLCENLSNDVISLEEAKRFYESFRKYLQPDQSDFVVLPLLSFLVEKGSKATVYEWKHGEAPSRIEAYNFDVLLKADDKAADDDDGDDIDFGDETDDIDFGDEVVIDIIADDSGVVGESVAMGEDAMGIIENPATQRLLKQELNELLAFLSMRKEDENREIGADLYIRNMEQRPDDIAVKDVSLEGWISKINNILEQLNNPQKVHLFKIRSSPQFVEKLVSDLQTKEAVEGRYKRMAELMVTKQEEQRDLVVKNSEELKKVVDNTRQLQQQVQEEISQKYNGRRVNIMGGLTTALANL